MIRNLLVRYSRQLPTVTLILVATIWSGAFAAIKIALTVLTPTELVLARHLPPAIAYGLYLAISRRPETIQLVRQDGWRLMVMGFCIITGYQFCQNWGETRIPAGTTSLIIALNPAITAIVAARFISEPVGRWRALGLVVAFAGLYVAVRYGAGHHVAVGYWQGVLVTAIAPILGAIYHVMNRGMVRRHNPLPITGCVFIAGCLPVMFLLTPELVTRMYNAPVGFWIAILYLAFVNSALTQLLWTWVLKRVEVARAASFVYLVPVLALFWAWVFLDEQVTLWLGLGTVVLLVGVGIVQANRPFWTTRQLEQTR
ncbi:MAG: DMT family transporter [Candidatus Latescibacteria bacterium]|jgi:drug/metabolite transporter (DMT)-like permease|nr:DMT family transporter [Candidatus Latescibacterota bacterium]